jgi:glutathione S-transferase
MLTLYTFGPAFGLPDPSPFVMKAQMLLKLAGLVYHESRGGLPGAPKGKLPYVDDEGTIVADSTFIRWHIERKYRFDFDKGLSDEQRGIGWAVEKMCEDHLYWAILDARWLDKANFRNGPAHFFELAPAPVRPFAKQFVRRQVRRALHGHGIGRHGKDEIAELAKRDLDAIAAIMGNKHCLLDHSPCGADAAVFAFVAAALCDRFDTPIRAAAEAHASLVAYRDRMLQQFYPDLPKAA